MQTWQLELQLLHQNDQLSCLQLLLVVPQHLKQLLLLLALLLVLKPVKA